MATTSMNGNNPLAGTDICEFPFTPVAKQRPDNRIPARLGSKVVFLFILTLFAAMWAHPEKGQARELLVQKVALEGDVIAGVTMNEDFHLPGINDYGFVAFLNGTDSLMTQFMWNPAPLQYTNYVSPFGFDHSRVFAINNAGLVAFSGQEHDWYDFPYAVTESTIFTWDIAWGRLGWDTLADKGDTIDGNLLTELKHPSINDSGAEAFWASYIDINGDYGEGIFLLTAAVVRTGDQIDGKTLVSIGSPSINNAGEMAFWASYEEAGDIKYGIFTQHGAVALPGDIIDGRLITKIAAPLSEPSINNTGEVAFIARFASGVVWKSGVFSGSRLLAADGDTIGGKTIRFIDSFPPAISDSGEVAFLAFFDPGVELPDYVGMYGHFTEFEYFDTNHDLGIFTQDRVVAAPGDTIGDKTLIDLPSLFSSLSINRYGDVTLNGRFLTSSGFVSGIFIVEKSPGPLGPLAYGVRGGEVSVIDTGRFREIDSIPVGATLQGIAITPDESLLYVTTFDGKVVVIDPATNTVTNNGISVEGIALDVVFSRDGASAYVTHFANGRNYVSEIDTATETVARTFVLGPNPFDPTALALTPDGRFAYVTNYADDTVSVIDLASDSVNETAIAVGDGPLDVDITPDGAFAYVVNRPDFSSNGTVSVIRTADNTVIATIPVGDVPSNAVITPDGAFVYVANMFDRSLSVIDTATNNVVQTIANVFGFNDLTLLQTDMAVTADGAFVYAGRIVVDTATNTPLFLLTDVGGSDIAIAHTPPNSTPTADAGPDQTVEVTSVAGADLMLDGSGSSDPDNDELTYVWSWPNGGAASGIGPTIVLPLGTHTITLQVDDGLAAHEDSVQITVADTTAPAITAPADIAVNTDPGQATAVVAFPPATATDNSGEDPSVIQTAGPTSGSAFAIGTTTVTWEATDAGGNMSSVSMTVTVSDGEAPVITLPPVVPPVEATGPETVVSIGAATAEDNVGVVSLTNDAPAAFPIGTTTVTWTARDAAGNMSSASMTVTVSDGEAPLITAPADIEVNTDPGQATAVVTFPPATATDNSGDAPSVIQTAGLPSGSSFAIGTTTLTWKATDAAGNMSSASMTVTVSDGEAPVITLPPELPPVEATGPETVVAIGAATAEDNVGVVSLSNDAPAAFPVGTTTVTWTALDAAGNESQATQEITVVYVFGAFLPPLREGKIYKANRTLQVKFQLSYDDGELVPDANVELQVFRLSGEIGVGDEIDLSTDEAADSGAYFRYDEEDGQYVYNLSTRGFDPGLYRLQAVLNNGQNPHIDISLK